MPGAFTVKAEVVASADPCVSKPGAFQSARTPVTHIFPRLEATRDTIIDAVSKVTFRQAQA